MNKLTIQEFDFMDHIVVAVQQDNMWWFSPRHICENIGITWPAQQKKLKRETEKFNCSLMATVSQDGKGREMLMIPANRVDTWILSININKVNNLNKRNILKSYQDQLSDWLYSRNFLTKTEITEVLNTAQNRGALTLDQRIEVVKALPDNMNKYKDSRIELLTDIKLGIEPPEKIGELTELTERDFYRAYMIEGYVDDKLICLYPQLSTPHDVEEWAQKLGLKRDPMLEFENHDLISMADGALMTKMHLKFNYTISDLVILYNFSGESIRYAIAYHMDVLYGIFEDNCCELNKNQSQYKVYNNYINSKEWKRKRNAFFSIFNCCVDCPPHLGWEIVSKHFNAHHLHYETLGKEEPGDLVPLCRRCHWKREQNKSEPVD